MSADAGHESLGPCSGIEPEVADRVESAMPAVGITPGDRECHDAQKGHLRVDFVYPGGLPRPFALEITAIVAPEELKGTRASMLLAERLSKTAEADGLGGWLVMVRMDRDMRLLEPEIIKIIREAQPLRE